MVVGAVCLAVPAARAQRVEFPSPASTFGATTQPALPPFDPYAIPSNTPPLAAPSLPPGAPVYGAPSPYAPPPVYGAPYNGAPTAIYPDGVPVYNGPTFEPITDTWTKTMRFLQEVHVDETYLPRFDGDRGMGVNTINTWVTFAIPFYYNANPLLITPGFQLYLWDGPDATGVPPPTLPGSTYGAYIDAAWNPQINNWLGAELEISPGVYTDFQHTTSESIRVLGRGLGVLTLTDTLKFKFGIWYIDRIDIKLLPAVGFLCTPNPDARYEIFFPAPKLAHRCATIGNHNVWCYVRGEYGGGAWTVERPPGGTQTGTINDEFEYSDIRVAVGADFLPETQTGLRGFFEVGFVFNRDLVYRSRMPGTTNLDDTMLIAGGLSF